MRQILLSTLFLAIIGCSDATNNQKQNTKVISPADPAVPEQTDTIAEKTARNSILSDPDLKDYIVANIPGNDFTLLTERSAIFISPDTLEIERMKKEYGEDDFYTAADDNLYYDYEAGEFLKQKGIKTIYPKTRYLKIRTSAGQEYFFDTKPKGSPNWYLILFDPSKDHPAIISSIDVIEDYSNYFGKL